VFAEVSVPGSDRAWLWTRGVIHPWIQFHGGLRISLKNRESQSQMLTARKVLLWKTSEIVE